MSSADDRQSRRGPAPSGGRARAAPAARPSPDDQRTSASAPPTPRRAAIRTSPRSSRSNNPGEPEVAQRHRRATCPRASSATRGRSTNACSADFALNRLRAGLAGRAGDDLRQLRRQPQLPARHGAGLQHGAAQRDETARLRFVAPTVEHPDHDPDHRAQRLRLRPAAQRHGDPAADPARRRADFTIWGFPADPTTTRTALPDRLARRSRPAARALAEPRCTRPVSRKPASSCGPTSTTRASAPAQPLPVSARRVRATRTPTSRAPRTAIPGDDRLRETSNSTRSSTSALTTCRGRLALGPRHLS